MFRLRASYVTAMITGATLAVVAGFTLAFSLLLSSGLSTFSSATTFFSSAGLMMYVTIEGMFMCGIIAAAYFVIKK